MVKAPCPVHSDVCLLLVQLHSTGCWEKDYKPLARGQGTHGRDRGVKHRSLVTTSFFLCAFGHKPRPRVRTVAGSTTQERQGKSNAATPVPAHTFNSSPFMPQSTKCAQTIPQHLARGTVEDRGDFSGPQARDLTNGFIPYMLGSVTKYAFKASSLPPAPSQTFCSFASLQGWKQMLHSVEGATLGLQSTLQPVLGHAAEPCSRKQRFLDVTAGVAATKL